MEIPETPNHYLAVYLERSKPAKQERIKLEISLRHSFILAVFI